MKSMCLTALLSAGLFATEPAIGATIAGQTVTVTKSSGSLVLKPTLTISGSGRSFSGSTSAGAISLGVVQSDLPAYFKEWRVTSSSATLNISSSVNADATFKCSCVDYDSDPYEYDEYDVRFSGAFNYNDGSSHIPVALPSSARPDVISSVYNGAGYGFAKLRLDSEQRQISLRANGANRDYDVNVGYAAAGSIYTSPERTIFTSANSSLTYQAGAVWAVQERLPVLDLDKLERYFNYLVSTVDGAKDVFTKYVTSFDLPGFIKEIGEKSPTGISGALTRVGGVINSFLTGLLDPDVAKGVKVINDTANDPDPNTRGLLWSPERRRQLQEAIDAIDSTNSPPIQPIGTNGNSSIFNFSVTGGTAYTIDPLRASGFEYRVGEGDPLFASFALPSFGSEQLRYSLSTWDGLRWIDLGLVSALTEFRFNTPVSAFRIGGIPSSAGITDADHSAWVSMISFAGDGRFTGTLTSFTAPGIPEPKTWTFFIVGFGAVGYMLRMRSRAAFCLV